MKKILVLLLMSVAVAMPAYAMENDNNASFDGSAEGIKVIEKIEEQNSENIKPGETVAMILEVRELINKKSKSPNDRKRANELVGKLVIKWQEKREKADDATTSIEERSKQAWERGTDAQGLQTMIKERLDIIRLARQVFEESEASHSPNDNESTVEEELRKEEDEVNLMRENAFEDGSKVLADASEKNKEVLKSFQESLKMLEGLYRDIRENIENDVDLIENFSF